MKTTAKIGTGTYELECETATSWKGSALWNGTELSCWTGSVRRLTRGITRALLSADSRGPLARTLTARAACHGGTP